MASTQQSIPAAERQSAFSGTHAVIDALSGVVVATGNRRFQVDDTRVRLHPAQFIERGAPNVRRFGVSGNWAIRLLGQTNIILCRGDVVFVKRGVAGMRQHLINASSRHDVAAQEQPYGSRWPRIS